MEFTSILSVLSSFFKTSVLTKKKSIPFTVFILSPHPDDECISGSLALRLGLENQMKLINIAVTLGSNKERQKERLKELRDANKVLNMKMEVLGEDWKTKEKELKILLEKYRPQIVIAPHVKDHHPAHVKTGELLLKTVKKSKLPATIIAWSEFWGPQKKINLLLEVPQEVLELQIKALQKHVGEIKRNPYHLRLPAWMMDNVRRGSELVSGKGSEAPNMAYGVLHQLQLLKNKKITSLKLKKSVLTSEDDIGQMFKLILLAASGSKTKTK